jgi:nitrite reductase/ring-hydroxylating ferredoxin subunit
MAEFVEAADLDSLPPGRSVAVTINGQNVAIFNVNGTVYAIEDRCLHQSTLLSTGNFLGKTVTCRRHGWRYDVTTGYVANVPGYGVTRYETKVVEGKILIEVGSRANGPQ